jgi:cytoskeletal protein CcmA (bactofilin family)
MATGVIAEGLLIRGELIGEEDLVVEGTIEGTISMKRSLMIEPTGVVKADIETENIDVKGEIEGNLNARNKITIHDGAKVVGDISAPRLDLGDGAYYKGRITMTDK